MKTSEEQSKGLELYKNNCAKCKYRGGMIWTDKPAPMKRLFICKFRGPTLSSLGYIASCGISLIERREAIIHNILYQMRVNHGKFRDGVTVL